MQGKTHFVVGIASALLICKPQTFPMLVAGSGMAAAGGVLCDIDSGNSSAHQDADRIIAVLTAIMASIVIADLNLHLGLYERLLKAGSQPRQISVLMIFLAVCAFGKSTKHRSFMHSIPAWGILSLCVWLIVPDLLWYFVISFGSHLLLDLLNRRKVRLLWPMKKGWCIGFCTSSGWVNALIFSLGLAAVLFLVFTSVPVRNTGTVIGNLGNQIWETVRKYGMPLWEKLPQIHFIR